MFRGEVVPNLSRQGRIARDCSWILRSAEKEITSFYGAVWELYGKEQAQKAALDWIEVMEATTTPPDETIAYWRRVTILAADRLASRICHPASVCAP